MTAASIKLGEGTPPTSTPGVGILYFDDSDQQLYVIDAAGVTVGPIGVGSGITQLTGDATAARTTACDKPCLVHYWRLRGAVADCGP